jgi:hypothetical protein
MAARTGQFLLVADGWWWWEYRLETGMSHEKVHHDFRGLMFADIKTERQNGNIADYRIMVIKKMDDQWYVYPTPQYAELMSAGLNSETESPKNLPRGLVAAGPR